MEKTECERLKKKDEYGEIMVMDGDNTPRILVEFRRSALAPLTAFCEKRDSVRRVHNGGFLQALYKDAALRRVVENLETRVGLILCLLPSAHTHGLGVAEGKAHLGGQKVAKLLVIQLNKGDFDAIVGYVGLEMLKKLEEDPGDHTCPCRGGPKVGRREIALHCVAKHAS